MVFWWNLINNRGWKMDNIWFFHSYNSGNKPQKLGIWDPYHCGYVSPLFKAAPPLAGWVCCRCLVLTLLWIYMDTPKKTWEMSINSEHFRPVDFLSSQSRSYSCGAINTRICPNFILCCGSIFRDVPKGWCIQVFTDLQKIGRWAVNPDNVCSHQWNRIEYYHLPSQMLHGAGIFTDIETPNMAQSCR